MVIKQLRCGGIALWLLAMATTMPAYGQDKLRIGLSSVSALHSALWVAEQRGLFRKHGIDTEIIVTGQGGNTGIGALLANDIQIASAGGRRPGQCRVARRRYGDDRRRH